MSSTCVFSSVMGATREGKMLLAYRGQGRKSLIVEGAAVCEEGQEGFSEEVS